MSESTSVRALSSRAANGPATGRLLALVFVLALPAVLLAAGPVSRGLSLVPGAILYTEVPPWQGPLPSGLKPCEYPLGDVVVQFSPWTSLVVEAYRSGRLPLWNPYSNAGSPLLANGQSAPFFPTRIADVFLSPVPASWLSAYLKLAVAGLGMLVLARRLGLGAGPALFAAAAFELGGFLAAWLAHPHSNVAALLPLLLVAADRAVERPGARSAALLALVVGAQFLGGHPETSFHAILGAAAFALFRAGTAFRADRSPRLAARRAAALASGAALGAALAAAALLPLLEYVRESSALFARSAKEAAGREALPGLDPSMALALAFPRAIAVDAVHLAEAGLARFNNFCERSGGYAGLATLAAAAAGIAIGWSRRRGLVLFLVGTLLACGLLVYDLGLPSRLLGAAPLLSIAINRRFLLLVGLAIALLAAIGLEGALGAGEPRRRGRWVLAVALGAAGAALSVAAGRGAAEGTSFALAQAAGLAGVALALFVRTTTGRAAPAFGLAIAGLAVDLVAFGAPIHRGAPAERLYPDTPLLARLRDATRDGSRVSGEDGVLKPETSVVPRLRSIKGYDAVEIRRYTELLAVLSSNRRRAATFVKNVPALDRLASPVLDLLAARYVLAPRAIEPLPPGLTLESVEEGVFVYVNAEALPRALVVPHARVVRDAAERLEALARGFDPRSEVLLETDAPPLGERPGGGEARATAARLVVDEPERVVVETDEVAGGGYLVLADAHYPGWRADVDGREVEILRANHALRAVPVGPGAHRVTFRFAPLSVRVGLAASGVAAIVLVLMLVAGARAPGRQYT